MKLKFKVSSKFNKNSKLFSIVMSIKYIYKVKGLGWGNITFIESIYFLMLIANEIKIAMLFVEIVTLQSIKTFKTYFAFDYKL